jgi:hypothetical protein
VIDFLNPPNQDFIDGALNCAGGPKALTAKTGSVDRLMSIVESTLQFLPLSASSALNPNFRFVKAELITPLKSGFTRFFSSPDPHGPGGTRPKSRDPQSGNGPLNS